MELLAFDGMAWTLEETGLEGPSFNSIGLVRDSDGRSHVLFYRDGVLLYATNVPGGWTETAISSAPYLLGALTLDLDGHPHVAVSHAGTTPNGQVYHLWNDGSGWMSEEILPAGDPFPTRYVRGIGMDRAGHILVAHTDAVFLRGEVVVFTRFAYHDGSQWRSGPRGMSRRGELGSFSLGPDGSLHFACARFGLLYMRVTLPDIEATWSSAETRPEGEGLRARGTLRLRNLGAGRSRPTRVEFYLSDDDRLDEGDKRVGAGRRLDGIRPGREREFAVSLALPAAAAGRRLLAVVDPAEHRDDLDRPNNTAALLLGD